MISLRGCSRQTGRELRKRPGLLLAVLPLLLVACTRDPGGPGYVARVGSAELTEDELRRTIDTLGVRGRGTQDMVNDWIINELLYQEAARRGLADSEPVRRQLDATRKHLAISALLDEELYLPGDTGEISDERIRHYLKRAPTEYTLREDVALVSYTIFRDRESASAFRTMLLGGASWSNTLANIESDSSLAPRLRRAVVRAYVTERTLYPHELWKLARTVRNNDVSYVVTTDAGYAVMTVYELRRQGEIPDLEYVRNEVRDRILIEQRQNRFEALISRLRSRSTVELHLLGSDTTAGSGQDEENE